MQPSKANYPFSYKAANAVGQLLVAARFPSMRLDEDSLVAAAVKEANLSDFGDPYYHNGLSRLLDSCEREANLHPLGRFVVRDLVSNYLVQRLRLEEARKREPEVFQQPLRRPLIICGLARSGTTFLHNMLALDSAHRALPNWLLMRPFPEKEADGDGPDPRIAKMERGLRIRAPMLPGLDAIHYMRADTPEECIVVLGLTFNGLIFSTLLPVFSYMEWYLQYEDAFLKYRDYRRLLQVFQSQEPAQRLTLKAPAHTGNLEALTEAVPEALLIQTHRDPVACVSSACSLVATYHRAVSNEIDLGKMADLTLRLYESWCRRSIAFHEDHPGVVYDVIYDNLVADPVGTVRGIYENFDLPWTTAYASGLDAYVNDNPKNKHGKHRYNAADFGLSDIEIASRLAFYSDYFGLGNSLKGKGT